jgi:hypothetical protein
VSIGSGHEGMEGGVVSGETFRIAFVLGRESQGREGGGLGLGP